jgi:predicted outer membrane protein
MKPLRTFGILLASVIFTASCGDNLGPDDDTVVPGGDEGGGGDNNGGGGDDEAGQGNAAADAASAEGEAVGGALAAQAEGLSCDVARLGGILLAIDEGEIAQAQVALDVAIDPEVIDYAALMRDAHTAHAASVHTWLDAAWVSPVDTSISTALRAEATAGVSMLQGTAREAIDFAYLRVQVKMHAAGDVLLARLIQIASGHPQLVDFLRQTHDAVVHHRREAETLLRAR